jgi:hypothetical protein
MTQVPLRLVAAVLERRAYIDKIAIEIRELPASLFRRIERIFPPDGQDRVFRNERDPLAVDIRQPKNDELRKLNRLLGDRAHKLCVEFALDFVMSSREAKDELAGWLLPRLVAPDCTPSPTHNPYVDRDTLYLAPREWPNNFVVYYDKRAAQKLGLSHVLHLERRERVSEMKLPDLLGVDYRGAWRKQLALYEVPSVVELGRRLGGTKCSEARRGNMIRRAVGIDNPAPAHGVFHWAKEHLDAPRSPGDLMDQIDIEPLLPPPCKRPRKRVALAASEMMSLSDPLWQMIERLIPTRMNTHRHGGGRPPESDRKCMNAILSVAMGAANWRGVNSVCRSSTARDRLSKWKAAGLFGRLKQLGHPELDAVDWNLLGCP